MYLKFPISNGEFHSTHETLSASPNCTVRGHVTYDFSSNTKESSCTSACRPFISTPCHDNRSFVAKAFSKIHKIQENISTPWKPKCLQNINKSKKHGLRVCYHFGDTYYKFSNYTFG